MEAIRADRPPRRQLRRKPKANPGFEQLYRRHAREVYQYALALLTNPADAEDATQTAFLNAYKAYQRGERPQKPHNWLIAITHNVCRMRWRQAGSRPREVALENAPEPVALEHQGANLDAVLTALAQLSFNQRSALVMRELEGRSYQEIADVLDLSVGAVEALLFRARRRLKLQRGALGVLTTVPLPGSLTSLFGVGGGAVAAGGAAVGADVVLKAAAVVVAGAVAGVGYKSVQAVKASPGRAVPLVEVRQERAAPSRFQALSPAAERTRAKVRQHPTKLRKATVAPAHSRLAPATASTTSAPAAAPATPVTSSSPVASTPVAAAVASFPAAAPKLPVTPTKVQTPPVQLPQLPLPIQPPAVPPLTVTVPTPALPHVPTPALPPVPPLPLLPPLLPHK